jgi:hypothetical protein
VNKRLGQLARRWLTEAGFEVTRVGHGASPGPTYTVSQGLIDQYLESCLGATEHVAVDIAAADGKSGSNTYALFRGGWRGLAVEAAPLVFARLGLNYRNLPEVSLYRGWVTPTNVDALLKCAEIPTDFGFLSLDIDGYDHDLLDVILSSYRPRLVCVEINERFPPPLLFNVPYSPRYQYAGDGCFGQSISMLDSLRANHNYGLVGLDYGNAFLVPSELGLSTVSPAEAYRTGYADRPDRKSRFPWNDEFEPLQTLPADEAVEWIERRFSRHRGEFVCSTGGS